MERSSLIVQSRKVIYSRKYRCKGCARNKLSAPRTVSLIGQASPSHVITIDTLSETAELNLYQGSHSKSFKRIPQKQFEANRVAYTPQYVSIGPVHNLGMSFNSPNDVNVLAMEGNKQECMLCLLKATYDPPGTLSSCKNYVQQNLDRINGCYGDERDISQELMVKTLLVDAFFLLEFFLCMLDQSADLRLKSDYSIFWSLRRDAALLENQLPLFVLNDLIDIIRPRLSSQAGEEFTWQQMYINMLRLVRLTSDTPQQIKDSLKSSSHLLDLVTSYHLSQSSSMDNNISSRSLYKSARCIQLCSATRLNAAGIRFERANETNLLELKFENGVLKIPALVIHDYTATLLLNLLAYEHLNSVFNSSSEGLASYVMLMTNLVETKEDLELLESKGIIVNELGSREDGSKIFHNTSKHIINHKCFCFKDLCFRIESFANSRPRRYMTDLKKLYFKNPWTVISLFAAVTLLVLTALQTYYAIHPRNPKGH